ADAGADAVGRAAADNLCRGSAGVVRPVGGAAAGDPEARATGSRGRRSGVDAAVRGLRGEFGTGVTRSAADAESGADDADDVWHRAARDHAAGDCGHLVGRTAAGGVAPRAGPRRAARLSDAAARDHRLRALLAASGRLAGGAAAAGRA